MKFAVALAGGGSKGAYEMGAWDAFVELGIEFVAVVGTSIGAMNGVLMAQQNYEACNTIWSNLNLENFIKPREDMVLKNQDLFSLRNAGQLANQIIRYKRLDLSPLQDTITKHLDADTLMQSPVDYGLVTFIYPQMKSVKIWKDEIPKDKLREYMLASASFPGLMSMSIDGKRYMDGGVADNMPVSMLREKGYTNIIAVDIRGPYASRRELKASGANIVHVRNNRSLGSPFDMTPSVIRRNRTLGYLDTLQAFDELQGEYFYFTKESYSQLHREFHKYIAGLEYAGLAYGLPREMKYTADTYLSALKAVREQAQSEYRILRQNINFDIFAQALAHKDSSIAPIPDAKWVAMIIEFLCDSKASINSFLRIPMRSARRISNAAQFIQVICR